MTAEENTDLQSARRTMDKEIEALRMMEDELNGNLSKALDLMQSTKGRVIVTGMGKSGHIGSKIAATLASTGTPSFFVHPGEASHGDLGPDPLNLRQRQKPFFFPGVIKAKQRNAVLAHNRFSQQAVLFAPGQLSKRFGRSKNQIPHAVDINNAVIVADCIYNAAQFCYHINILSFNYVLS